MMGICCGTHTVRTARFTGSAVQRRTWEFYGVGVRTAKKRWSGQPVAQRECDRGRAGLDAQLTEHI